MQQDPNVKDLGIGAHLVGLQSALLWLCSLQDGYEESKTHSPKSETVGSTQIWNRRRLANIKHQQKPESDLT